MGNVEIIKRGWTISDMIKEFIANIFAIIGVFLFALFMSFGFLVLFWYGHYRPTYGYTFDEFIRMILAWI